MKGVQSRVVLWSTLMCVAIAASLGAAAMTASAQDVTPSGPSADTLVFSAPQVAEITDSDLKMGPAGPVLAIAAQIADPLLQVVTLVTCGDAVCSDANRTSSSVGNPDERLSFEHVALGVTNADAFVAIGDPSTDMISLIRCPLNGCANGGDAIAVFSAPGLSDTLSITMTPQGEPVLFWSQSGDANDPDNSLYLAVQCARLGCVNEPRIVAESEGGSAGALALGPDGSIAVATVDQSMLRLRVRRCLSCEETGTSYEVPPGPFAEVAIAYAAEGDGAAFALTGPRGVMIGRCLANDCSSASITSPNQDADGIVGDLALSVDRENIPVISYWTQGPGTTTGGVRVLRCQTSMCQDRAVGTHRIGTALPGSNAMVLDAAGLPVISRVTSTEVRLAVCDSKACGTAPTCDGLMVTADLRAGDTPTDGADVIRGTSGTDLIAAGAGDDVICGLEGDDQIWGQAGNDVILGGPGLDRLRGGPGNDILRGDEDSDDLGGGTGDDAIFGAQGADTARGGTGDDQIFGGEDSDPLLSGNGGEDQVFGGAGNDELRGGPRPDQLFGGLGNDVIKGFGGADVINGGDGDDDLRGGPQQDALIGGGGIDVCNGGTTDGAAELDTAASCEQELRIP